MKRVAAGSALCAMVLTSVALAQTPPSSSSQQRPDASYPNPSGQDSKPGVTPPKQTEPAQKSSQPSGSPQTAKPSAEHAYRGSTGKKPNSRTGCSTPTDARSAAGQGQRSRDSSKDTVCTTSGGDQATKPGH